MSTPKVVFVLGAGSSHGLGFPLGSELKGELLTHLEPQNQLFGALRSSGIQESDIRDFSRQLERAEYDTIDQHLREISDDSVRMIGKRAVAYLIRMKENENALFPRGQNYRHWYKSFVDHLAKFSNHISAEQFSFITFNYDRSLSHYLYETLRSRGVSAANLKFFLGPANFNHVHGHVGELPWNLEVGGDSKSYFQYGATLSVKDLSLHIPDILLPHDKRDSGMLLARLVGNAEIIAFVGFGFHPANMKILPFGESKTRGNVRRRYLSINPVVPPKGLSLDGIPIHHIKGDVAQVIPGFFSDLASGKLRATIEGNGSRRKVS